MLDQPAPDFRCAVAGGGTLGRDDLAGTTTVLLFYLEAATPDCRQQLVTFAAEAESLEALGARVVAISADPPERLAEWAGKLGEPFPLLSDPTGEAARAFGVWDAEQRRARRAAFILDAAGMVRLANLRYSVGRTGDVLEVFEVLERLAGG
ncbi:MAG TPA: redoxin domain-containing protein [Candidatus Dormibacteraeota bacterium]